MKNAKTKSKIDYPNILIKQKNIKVLNIFRHISSY